MCKYSSALHSICAMAGNHGKLPSIDFHSLQWHLPLSSFMEFELLSSASFKPHRHTNEFSCSFISSRSLSPFQCILCKTFISLANLRIHGFKCKVVYNSHTNMPKPSGYTFFAFIIYFVNHSICIYIYNMIHVVYFIVEKKFIFFL